MKLKDYFYEYLEGIDPNIEEGYGYDEEEDDSIGSDEDLILYDDENAPF